MASHTIESSAPLKQVKRVQFGILSPEEIVSCHRYKNVYI